MIVPEPFDSETVPAEVLPSPQSQVAVWVSATSISEKLVALATMAVFTFTGSTDTFQLMVPTVGASFTGVTVMFTVPTAVFGSATPLVVPLSLTV